MEQKYIKKNIFQYYRRKMSDVVTAAFANNEKVKCVESLLSHRLNG